MSDTTTPPKHEHGCLFYGVLAGVISLLALLVGFLLLLHMFNRALNQYTDTKPMALPAVKLSQPEIEELETKFNHFRDAVSDGRSVPPLALNSDELNGLIENMPELKEVKGKIHLEVQDNNLQALVSVPMTDLGLKPFKGRYLNGSGSLKVSLQNGTLTLTPIDVLVKGKPLPKKYQDRIRQQNLATGINNNSRASIALNRLQSIEIRDGKVVLIPKQPQ